MASEIIRSQYAQKVSEQFTDRKIFHFETDSKQVLIGDTDQVLDDLLKSLDGERSITLTGGVTGTVKTDGHSNVILSTEVTDDGHKHTGATIEVAEAKRVLISSDSKTVEVSAVTADELACLSGVTSNIQDQLDNKIKPSETNGNIIVDGTELPVYVHPTKDEFKVTESEQVLVGTGSVITSIKEIKVDGTGHISEIVTEPYKMSAMHKIWVSNNEPTGQAVGDFWLETLNVEVSEGEFFLQPPDGGNVADTTVVGSGTASLFTLTDPVTGETGDAGEYDSYTLLDPSV